MISKNKADHHGNNHDHLPLIRGEQMIIAHEQVIIYDHLYIYIIINKLYRQMIKALIIYGVFVFFKKNTDDHNLIKNDHLIKVLWLFIF